MSSDNSPGCAADPPPDALEAATKLWYTKLEITEPRTVHGRIMDIALALGAFRRAEMERCATIAHAHTAQSNPPARYTAIQIETRIRSGDST